MKTLLDVNALIAWYHPTAQDHRAFHVWRKSNPEARLFSCAITELGFVRISMQAFRLNAAQAAAALDHIRRGLDGYVAELPAPRLPVWAATHGLTTDAYLMQVAASAGLKLATFDTGIPGATLIR